MRIFDSSPRCLTRLLLLSAIASCGLNCPATAEEPTIFQGPLTPPSLEEPRRQPAVAFAPGFDPVDTAKPAVDPARGRMIRWIKANNRFGPDHKIVSDMTQVIDTEISKGTLYYAIAFGGGLLKSGKPAWLHSWAGHYFQFELSANQAKVMDLDRTSTSVMTSGTKRSEKPGTRLVKLEAPTFKGGKSIQGGEPITGKVKFQSLKEGDGKYALRIGYHAGNSTSMMFHYLDSIPQDDDSLTFSYRAINGKDDKPYTGPVVFFMDLVTVAQDGGNVNITVHSNTVARMVDVK